jgi:hypothetical protein
MVLSALFCSIEHTIQHAKDKGVQRHVRMDSAMEAVT